MEDSTPFPQRIPMYVASSTYVKRAERARGVIGRIVGSRLVSCGKSQVRTPASAFYLLQFGFQASRLFC